MFGEADQLAPDKESSEEDEQIYVMECGVGLLSDI